ncbi:hypothetical protein G6F65_018885 [Rhizopus arrhizus]|nr:hypothetical protein G6F65_018885 [Rhizopus arrhizus]
MTRRPRMPLAAASSGLSATARMRRPVGNAHAPEVPRPRQGKIKGVLVLPGKKRDRAAQGERDADRGDQARHVRSGLQRPEHPGIEEKADGGRRHDSGHAARQQGSAGQRLGKNGGVGPERHVVAAGGVGKAGNAEHQRNRQCRQRQQHPDHNAVDPGVDDGDCIHLMFPLDWPSDLAGDDFVKHQLAVTDVEHAEIGHGLALLAEVQARRGAVVVHRLAGA